MKSGTILWGGAIAAVAVAAVAAFHRMPRHQPSAATQWTAPLATPPGVTLQLRTEKAEVRHAPAADLVYADAKGMTLYTYTKDGASGTSNCAGECLTLWPPAVPPPEAVPVGDWGVIRRADGTRQWAYRGAPLHRFNEDAVIGDAKGDATGDAKGDRDTWHAAVFRPGAGIVLRAGIGVREIDDAGGVTLVDHSGLTVYVFDGDAAPPAQCRGDGDCLRHWIPLRAAGTAMPAGNFSVISRDDGIAQWAYFGKPLYTFDRDTKPLDVYGMGTDPRFRPALIERFFMPGDAAIRRIIPLGNILTTVGGATLYQRDRAVTDDEGHNFREDHGSPALGRSFGTATCDSQCTATWRPFVAPANALPSGYWEILTRADGTRQWAYKGFALYTYAGDGPGDIRGNETYDLVHVRDKPGGGEPQEIGLPPRVGTGVGALFWHAVIP
jgi:predicted lipoprotein with Yx(FWY)xxD motif